MNEEQFPTFSKVGQSLERPSKKKYEENPDPPEKIHVTLTLEEYEWIKAVRAAKVCHRKRSYDTLEEANHRAKFIMTMENNLLESYLCKMCQKYHLTSV